MLNYLPSLDARARARARARERDRERNGEGDGRGGWSVPTIEINGAMETHLRILN